MIDTCLSACDRWSLLAIVLPKFPVQTDPVRCKLIDSLALYLFSESFFTDDGA
jgi:hypothetical protein